MAAANAAAARVEAAEAAAAAAQQDAAEAEAAAAVRLRRVAQAAAEEREARRGLQVAMRTLEADFAAALEQVCLSAAPRSANPA